MIIINDNSIQVSVKQIPFYINVKGKIRDNLGHKTQHTLSSSSELIFKLPINFKPTSIHPHQSSKSTSFISIY